LADHSRQYERCGSITEIALRRRIGANTVSKFVKLAGGTVKAKTWKALSIAAIGVKLDHVADHGERFAYAGRCGVCLTPGTYGVEHACEPVRSAS